MGARGAKVKDITAEFDVQIKFPERDTNEAADIPLKNNDESAEAGTNDIIKITGRPENCEAAKKALLEQVNKFAFKIIFFYRVYLIKKEVIVKACHW